MKISNLLPSLPPAEPWWRHLSAATWRADLLAGLLGALLVLPQGVAFARLAGLPSEYGLYAAIVPCIVAAVWGSSRHVMSGPTNANSLALFAMLSPLAAPGSPDYLQLVFTVTFLVGVLQLLVALLRLGSLANFIAPSVLLGFTGGAACLIAWHAVLDLAHMATTPTQAWSEWTVAGVTLLATWSVSRWRPRWPAMLLGLAAGYLCAQAMPWWHWPAPQSMGHLPSVIPPLSHPNLHPAALENLVGISLALAVVAMGQSISIAKAIGDRSGQHIDPNREFLGQGLANIVASFSSSYLVCGSLNRSLPNYEAGAKTPMAAVLSALLLLALAAALTPLLEGLPMAAIEALLLLVAWGLIDTRKIRETLHFGYQEGACLVVTWAAVLVWRIEMALLLGVGLSLLFHLYQTARPAMRELVPAGRWRHFTPIEELPTTPAQCPQLKLVRMEGPVFFGAAQHVSETLRRYREDQPQQKHLLVMVRSMNFVDQAGERVWRHEEELRSAMGGALYFHRPRRPVIEAWQRTGLLQRLQDRIFHTNYDALQTIVPQLDPQICAQCSARIFHECDAQPGADATSIP